MRQHGSTSKQRFREYRQRRDEQAGPAALPDPGQLGLGAKRSRSFFVLFRELWRLGRGQRSGMVWALVSLSVATAVGLVMPASTKFVLDYILTDHPGPTGIPTWLGLGTDRMRLLLLLSGAMVTASIVGVGFGLAGRWRMTAYRLKLQAQLRRKAFEHAVRLPMHRIYSIRSGGLSSMLRDDAAGAGELLFSMIYNPWRAVLQLSGTLVILSFVDWRLLVGAVTLFPIIFYTHRTWINRIRPVYRDIRRTRQGIDAQSAEVFGGMRVVRAFNREHGEASRYVRATHYMLRQEALVWWRARLVDTAWRLLIPLASVAVLLYGGAMVIHGVLTIGDVMMFSAYLLMLLGPLEALASSATQIQNSLAGFDRTLDLLEEPTEFANAQGARLLDRARVQGGVTFDHVSFRYPDATPDSQPVLCEIDLDVAPGETIALVGSSGSGKTTLSNLVARFFDPTIGAILLDGVDLREISLDSYRKLLGVVEQDVFLFDGSIAQNIAFSRPTATKSDIIAAARASDADEFIEKIDTGYDTLIGERGVRLSGGQRQRLAIARAILADPCLLILDEATSNLDSESERLVQRSLANLMRGRTSFVIAHRLSTIRHADRIVVLDGGCVVEVGTHQELWAQGGRYATLLTLQLGERATELTDTVEQL